MRWTTVRASRGARITFSSREDRPAGFVLVARGGMPRSIEQAKAVKAPLPLIMVVASFLCPTELSLYVAGLRLPPHRIMLLALFPIAVYRLLSRRDIRIQSFDVLFVLYAAWTTGVYAWHTGGHDGFVYGGSLALESLASYLIARAWIRDAGTFLATLKVLTVAVAVAGLVALPETLFGKIFTHDLLRMVTGYEHPTGIEQRLGLTRAYGTFDHPIHFGTFVASILAMVWYAERRTAQRNAKAALIAGTTFLGLSSAPLLCLGLQSGMIVWERISRGVAARGGITLAILAGLYIGVSLISTRSPIAIVATGFTIDSWTGFYRLQIWEYGLESVWDYPWAGIGLNDWHRPTWMVANTVDAFWLVTAMRAGIPAFLLLAFAIILLLTGVYRFIGRTRDRYLKRLAIGWMMSMIALSLIACTVHFWNVPHAYYFFFVGLAGWIADPVRAPARSRHRRRAASYPAAVPVAA